MAQSRALIVEKLALLGKGLLNAALIAGKVILLAGMIPAMIAYIATMGILKGVLLFAKGAVWLFNIALYANPIGLIIAGIVALIAAIVAIVYWWDEWTGLLDSWKAKLGAFSSILYAIPILGPILLIRDLINTVSELWDTSDGFWGFFCNLFGTGWDKLKAPFVAITGWIADLFVWIGDLFGSISSLVSWIPGLGGDVANVSHVNESTSASPPPERLTVGGNSFSNSSRNTNYGGVNIYAPNGMSPGQMNEWSTLNA